MQGATRGILYIVSFVMVVYGLSDLVAQFKAGEELSWSVPLVFFCIGAGVLTFLILAPDMFSHGDPDDSISSTTDSDDVGGSDV